MLNCITRMHAGHFLIIQDSNWTTLTWQKCTYSAYIPQTALVDYELFYGQNYVRPNQWKSKDVNMCNVQHCSFKNKRVATWCKGECYTGQVKPASPADTIIVRTKAKLYCLYWFLNLILEDLIGLVDCIKTNVNVHCFRYAGPGILWHFSKKLTP